MKSTKSFTIFGFILFILNLSTNIIAQDLDYERLFSFGKGKFLFTSDNIAVDKNYIYLSTGNYLYRADKNKFRERKDWKRIYKSEAIKNIYVYGQKLFILQEPALNAEGLAEHVLLVSYDQGDTFEPRDEGLRYCYTYNGQEVCNYFSSSQIFIKNGIIFLNSIGSDILISHDEGKTFKSIENSPIDKSYCYDNAFSIIGNKVLVGGECPLDFAYLKKGAIDQNFLDWQNSQDPIDSLTDIEMSNRNIHFIKKLGRYVFAGAEGAIFRSTNNGDSYRATLLYPKPGSLDTVKYPYVKQITKQQSGNILASGTDKVTELPFLARSMDNGLTWVNVTKEIFPKSPIRKGAVNSLYTIGDTTLIVTVNASKINYFLGLIKERI
jgi:hypothetical protein